jgi:hypothetical protein
MSCVAVLETIQIRPNEILPAEKRQKNDGVETEWILLIAAVKH